ncbi:MAG: N-acetylneuraminate synthase family protein, partial [Smithella sp.]|nr:N-acetylneuraminate synthase family protein [Smithella sp.]
MAKKIIDAAKKMGADAVKFQSFKTEKIITESAPSADYHKRATGGAESWFDLLKRLELSENQQRELAQYCRTQQITFLS